MRCSFITDSSARCRCRRRACRPAVRLPACPGHVRENEVVPSDSLRPVSLAELVATLSLVADLGMGRPMERVLRQTVVAMRLGAAAGMDEAPQLPHRARRPHYRPPWPHHRRGSPVLRRTRQRMRSGRPEDEPFPDPRRPMGQRFRPRRRPPATAPLPASTSSACPCSAPAPPPSSTALSPTPRPWPATSTASSTAGTGERASGLPVILGPDMRLELVG